MKISDNLRFTKPVLNNGLAFPALGFGTLIPDPTDTKNAVIATLEVGFRQFDCAERYRNEIAVGKAFQQMSQSGKVSREEVFIGTKLHLS
jgi:diketogulonate reductase-like aldo/keto reductase